MNEKTLKFENIRINKKEFHKSKQPDDLASVNVDQIIISGKSKHTDEGSLSISLVIKKVKLLDRYVFFYRK